MDRGAWWAAVHGVSRARPDLATNNIWLLSPSSTKSAFLKVTVKVYVAKCSFLSTSPSLERQKVHFLQTSCQDPETG